MTAPPRDEHIHRIWQVVDDPDRGFTGSHIVSYNPSDGKVRDYGVILPRQGCRWMTMDLDREELHLISYPLAHFVVFRPKSGDVIDLGRLSQTDALGPTWSAAGYTYTTDDEGLLLRYDPVRERIEQLPLRLPDAPWRDPWGNFVRRMKAGPDGVKLYGYAALSARLFEYDPGAGPYGAIRDLGLPAGRDEMGTAPRLYPPKALTFGQDGRIYCGIGSAAMSIDDDQGAHIIAVDPDTGERQDYGLIQAQGLERIATCQDMTTGHDGTIYIAPQVKEQPLQLVLFHPEGKLPAERGAAARGEIVRAPIGHADPASWRALQIESLSLRTAFVDKGTMLARPLGWAGHTQPIPAGETSITALTSTNGKVYGATSGVRAHLFAFDPRLDAAGPWGWPIDLGILTESPATVAALTSGPDGRVYAGTNCQDGSDGHLFAHDPALEIPAHLDIWMLPAALYRPGQLEDMGTPVPGEGIVTLCSGGETWIDRSILYGMGSRGTFFVYDICARSTVFAERVPARFPSRALMVADDGSAYGAADDGRLFRFTPERGAIEMLDLWLPAGKGREYLNGLDSAVAGGSGGFYGGARADGTLFHFNPGELRITSLGKPVSGPRLPALVRRKDGSIFGLAGGDGHLTHLFRYRPGAGDLVDLGLPRATLPHEWHGHELECATLGPQGEIFMGETGRVARLFTYIPAE